VILYPGGVSETELLISYGATCFASKSGQLAGNHFLTIVSGVEHLRPLGVAALWQGARIIFSTYKDRRGVEDRLVRRRRLETPPASPNNHAIATRALGLVECGVGVFQEAGR
jgi:hypothetical protein